MLGGEPWERQAAILLAVRDWPPIVAMDDETKRLVDDRWSEYGFDG